MHADSLVHSFENVASCRIYVLYIVGIIYATVSSICVKRQFWITFCTDIKHKVKKLIVYMLIHACYMHTECFATNYIYKLVAQFKISFF